MKRLATPSARLLLVGGKGGVGKTSVACALAIEIAEASPRQRVLLLSTDPAHSIGHALGVSLGDEPCGVKGAPANLEAREIDAPAAFEIEKARYRASIDEIFESIFRGNMDASYDRAVLQDLLELAPPGLDELFALLGMTDALFVPRGRAAGDRPRYDVVVVDTAPTGHTLRLLALPETALEWVHAIMSIILKYRKIVGLGELATDLMDLAKRLRALIALLHDPAQCAFVAVARPGALPRLETERLVKELAKQRIPLARLVVNAVTQPTCARCREAAAHERPEVARLAGLAKRARAELVLAPAIHPPPKGPNALRAFRKAWFTA